MALIRATLMENAISAEQKQELLARITDAVVAVYGENMRPYTWVLLDDVKSGLWGVGAKVSRPKTSEPRWLALPQESHRSDAAASRITAATATRG